MKWALTSGEVTAVAAVWAAAVTTVYTVLTGRALRAARRANQIAEDRDAKLYRAELFVVDAEVAMPAGCLAPDIAVTVRNAGPIASGPAHCDWRRSEGGMNANRRRLPLASGPLASLAPATAATLWVPLAPQGNLTGEPQLELQIRYCARPAEPGSESIYSCIVNGLGELPRQGQKLRIHSAPA